jgi:hypothetical protein
VSAPPRAVERALAEHRAAAAAFCAAARALPDAAWTAPLREGGWSPAEIAEHLRLTYVQVIHELGGGAAMAPRASQAWQRLFRWVVLPHILFHRSIPVRARAPRETRPTLAVVDREALLAEFEMSARDFERGAEPAAQRGSPSFTHPYFGAISPLKAVRFVAIHIDHHRRQIERRGR